MTLSLVTAPTIEPLTVADVTRHLGIDASMQEPAPVAGPTAALAGAGAGNVDNGAHRYAVSVGTPDGETVPSPVSAAVTVADKAVNGKVSLTGIELGGGAATYRKLWRTVAGGSTLYLLATIADNTTTTYLDNIADSALGAAAPSVNTTSDPQLLAFIQAARERVEDITGRQLIDATYDYFLDDWCDEIELPRPNLRSVTSVSYVDTDGAAQTLSTAVYAVDTLAGPRAGRGRIRLAYSQTWPTARAQRRAITIRFVAGYGAAASAVPQALKTAMLLMIADWFAIRENTVVGTITAEVPLSALRLIKPYISRAESRAA